MQEHIEVTDCVFTKIFIVDVWGVCLSVPRSGSLDERFTIEFEKLYEKSTVNLNKLLETQYFDL